MKKRNRISRVSVCLVLLALAVAVPALAGCGGLEAVETVVKAGGLEDTVDELKGIQKSVGQLGQTVTAAGEMVKNPVGAAVDTAKSALAPKPPAEADETETAKVVETSEEAEQATAELVAEIAPSDSELETELQETATQAEILDPIDADQEEESVPQEQSHE